MHRLKNLRLKIDALDDEILRLLGERYKLVREAGQIKADTGLDLVQSERVKEVLSRVSSIAEENDLDPDFVRGLYREIISQSHVIEKEIIEANGRIA